MSKKYTLYLDESGDFDKDLEIPWKNECLVGGLLVDDRMPLKQERAKQLLIASWKRIVSSDAGLAPDQAFRRARHATELRGAEKAAMVSRILDEAESCGEFIIFENYKKTRIINSTLTYINIMADGIIQLLNRLVSEHPRAKIKLQVIAGFRKDTTVSVSAGRVEGYIGAQDCFDRIREHLELAKVKNHSVCASGSEVSFCYDDDKENSILILCDYICNFYLTRTAPVYRTAYKNTTLREYLLQKYQDKNIFSLYGNAEREKAVSYCSAQDYDSALYDICTGLMVQEDTVDMVLSAFLRLPGKVRQNHLRILGTYFNNLIGSQRNLELGSKVLERAVLLSGRLEEAGAGDLLFSLDIVLYQLTVASHLGQIGEMEKLFSCCRELLGQALTYAENLNYAFLYFNRYAVYLMDTFRVQEAFELLEQVKQQFAAYELILEELPGIRIAEKGVRSDQLGRILGTQVQCLPSLMAHGVCTYDNAVQISDQALDNLIFDADRQRQHQYRAHIECIQGNDRSALDNLCLGFNVSGWESLFGVSLPDSSFALYHLSCFVRHFVERREECQYADVKKIVRKFCNNEIMFFRSENYPDFITCANIAYAMNVLNFDTAVIKRYYKAGISLPDRTGYSPLFQMMKLILLSEYIAFLKDRQDSEDEMNILRMKEIQKQLKLLDIPESMQALLDYMDALYRENSASAYRSFSNHFLL